ncbi:MAG: glutamate-5-semialdehyde dehydrogenase [Desulfofustis sp.]|nr:glutamate-5-semialdehyde dehydrogenase [Desulfofustis sp.]
MAIEQTIKEMARKAQGASNDLATLSTAAKNSVLSDVALLLMSEKEQIQKENQKDLTAGREQGLSAAMLDRLELSDKVFESMVDGVNEVIGLPDPVGRISDMSRRPSGITVGRMRIPLGVVAMIYESRPNVTIDAAVLCLKAGNGVVLRGGSEALHSNIALAAILQKALHANGINPDGVQVVDTTDRQAIEYLLQQEESIDLIIPRGGEGLIRFVSQNSRIPVLKHYKGVCHVYVDADADLEKATPIIMNSKTQRPGVCNALEGLLVHRDVASHYLPSLAEEFEKNGVTMIGCPATRSICPQAMAAKEEDWGTEWLSLNLCIKIVDSVEEAKEYISLYGSKHTETIVTENYTTAQDFLSSVDASAVMVNASTRFNDGGQLGLGTEIGISTTKLHSYGPMGLEELTTRKFVVYGTGQVRN